MKIIVIGGGYIGQLVQLAVPSVRILDWRKTPPADYLESRIGPQYLWEPIPGIKSTSFEVITLVDGKEPTEKSILAYKQKIGKEHDGGNWGLQFQHKTVGWFSRLPVPFIEYNRRVVGIDIMAKTIDAEDSPGHGERINYDMIVSTIPLDALLKMMSVGPFGVPSMAKMQFKNNPIFMRIQTPDRARNEMVLNYISDPSTPEYRVTVFKDREYRESLTEFVGADMSTVRRLIPGKIHPNPHAEYIVRELASCHVYCFGRFATWSPDELAHETWRHIVSWKEAMGL